MLELPAAIKDTTATWPVRPTVTTWPAPTEFNKAFACKPVKSEPVVSVKMLENGAPENGASPNMSAFQKGAEAPVN
jgi:hypothetical protein